MKNLNRYQLLAFLPVTVLLVGASFFQDLVRFAINANAVMNMIIIGAALVGIVIMHQLIWSVRRQSNKAARFITLVKQGNTMKEVLKDPELGKSDIGLVCDYLVHDHEGVGGNQDEVVEAGLRSLHVTLDSRQELAHFMVGFLVALGLMGTFIGILETLIEIGNMIGGFATSDMQDIDKSFMGLISDLTKPLKGMGTAFSASMFGLLGSLCLGLTMVNVRRCTEEFVTGMRHAIFQIIKDRRVGQFEHVTDNHRRLDSGMAGGTDELFKQSLEVQAKLIDKLDTLESRFVDLSAVMKRQVDEVSETNVLMRANAIPKETTEQFMGQVKILARTTSENSTNLSALLPGLSGVTQNLSGFSNTLMQQRDQVQKTMLSSAETQGMIRTALTSLVEKENDIRAGMLNETKQMRKFILEMQPIFTQMLPLISEINSKLNEQLVASNNQQETTRLMAQAVTETFGGLKTGISEMLLDAENGRQQQAELAKQLMNAQRTSDDFNSLQHALVKMTEVLNADVATSEALVKEMGNIRETMLRDMRIEMQQALRIHDAQRSAAAPAAKDKS
ncbi:MAG: hypothetical protein R8M11_09760 [Gallionella sp.]